MAAALAVSRATPTPPPGETPNWDLTTLNFAQRESEGLTLALALATPSRCLPREPTGDPLHVVDPIGEFGIYRIQKAESEGAIEYGLDLAGRTESNGEVPPAVPIAEAVALGEVEEDRGRGPLELVSKVSVAAANRVDSGGQEAKELEDEGVGVEHAPPPPPRAACARPPISPASRSE